MSTLKYMFFRNITAERIFETEKTAGKLQYTVETKRCRARARQRVSRNASSSLKCTVAYPTLALVVQDSAHHDSASYAPYDRLAFCRHFRNTIPLKASNPVSISRPELVIGVLGTSLKTIWNARSSAMLLHAVLVH